MNSKNSLKNTENNELSTLILAEICRSTYEIDILKPLPKSSQMNAIRMNYGFQCEMILSIETLGIKLSVFTNYVESPQESDKVVFCFCGFGLNQGVVEQFISMMTSCVNQIELQLSSLCNSTSKLIKEAVTRNPLCSCFATGHGIGGYYAELVAIKFNLPGFGFCNPGLKNIDWEVLQQCYKNNSFISIVPDGDGVCQIQGLKHMCEVIVLELFSDTKSNNCRGYAEFHSITNIVKYFSRPRFAQCTNFNITSDDFSNAMLKSYKYGIDDNVKNYVFTDVKDLPLKHLFIEFYVIDLTSANNKNIDKGKGQLDKAIMAVNIQIKQDFSTYWSSSGTLKNVTNDVKLAYQRKYKQQMNSTTGSENELINWIIHDNVIKFANWSSSAVIFLVDKPLVSSSHVYGFHDEVVVNDLNIPYGVVYVADDHWSMTLSHEVLEILVDPLASRYFRNETSIKFPIVDMYGEIILVEWSAQHWYIEVCDPCMDVGYEVTFDDGTMVMVSDFVFPWYFDTKCDKSKPLNFLGTLTRKQFESVFPECQSPFPLLLDSYLPLCNPITNQIVNFYWHSMMSGPTFETLAEKKRNALRSRL